MRVAEGEGAGQDADALTAHNRFQQRYFDGSIRDTIAPRGSRHFTRQLDMTLAFAGLSAGDRVLEVGCGMGRGTLLMAERGVNIEGLDLSPALLEKLRAHNAGRFHIPLHCVDMLQPPPSLHGAFDLVLGTFVLHHLPNLETCFAAVGKLLKPGGRMVFLEANAWNPLFYLQIALTPGMTWEGDKGIARMRPRRLLRAMKEAGLQRIELARFGFFPASVADRAWGAKLDVALERVPLWRGLLPFQIVKASR